MGQGMKAGKHHFSIGNFPTMLRLVGELAVFLSAQKAQCFSMNEYFDVEVAGCRWVFPMDKLAFLIVKHSVKQCDTTKRK